jgi:anti-sigma regulatory factor (Ser/Thr protein kinase)
VLGIGWSEPMDEANVPASLDRVVELAQTTLARAWRFEVERDQARVLERVVLPTALPDTGPYDVAGRYIAPEVGQRVGGDVYDVLVRNDGAVGVMVADAVGHDLMATRAVARLRHAIGVLIMEGYSPAAVMSAVNAYVAASPSRRLVTCVCLLFAADGSAVTIANAGHPQPILCSGSAARSIGPVGQSLLGRAATTYTEVSIPLEPGDLVLSFTDGLIDRRGRSFLEGERWLVDFIETQPDNDAHAIANRLEAALVDAAVDDDMAFLVLSRPAPLDHRTVRWSGPAASVQLADRRVDIDEWLSAHAADRLRDDLLLVVTELLTNAREASNPDDEISMTVRRRPADDHTQSEFVEVVVTNITRPFDPTTAMPDPSSVRGRGLAIVEQVVRSLDVSTEDGSATVRAVLDLA